MDSIKHRRTDAPPTGSARLIRARPYLAAFALAAAAGACTAVLDFTECTENKDCAVYFFDNVPMICNEEKQRCEVKSDGCAHRSECAGLGEDYICGLTGACVDISDGYEYCDKPAYPDDTSPVVYVGSIVDREHEASVERGVQLAIDQSNAMASLPGDTKVARIACDSGGDAGVASDAAAFLAGSENSAGALAIVGPADDSEFRRVVEQVTLSEGVFVYTISPTAVVQDFAKEDTNAVVWHGRPAAARTGRAMVDRMADLAPASILCIVRNDAYSNAIFSYMNIGEPNAPWIDVATASAQAFQQYVDTDAGSITEAVASALESLPDPEVVLILGQGEVGAIITELAAQAAALPTTILVPGRAEPGLVEAVASHSGLLDAVELIAPAAPASVERFDQFAALYQDKFGGAPDYDAARAYDATLLTLFGMAGTQAPIRGPKITNTVIGRLSAGAPINLADPNTFAGGVSDLVSGGNVDLEGVMGPLNIDSTNHDVCGDLGAFKVNGASQPALAQEAVYSVACPGEAGSWSSN